jgi:hypothetical protein
MSMVTSPSEQRKTFFFLNLKNPGKTGKKTKTFFNPETETDPDRKLTFEQKIKPDPRPKSKSQAPAGLYSGLQNVT